MTFSADYKSARVRPSPNYGERRDGIDPDTIILHYTGMASAKAAEDWLCIPESQVSSHYLVYEDGAVVQMVPEKARAWHAGVSFWQGETDLNSRSVGIEIANPGHDHGYTDFPDAQIASVILLCRDIIDRWAILPRRVLAHSDIAPGRKVDPGEKFPWQRLAAEGVGFYITPTAIRAGTSLSLGDEGEDVKELQIELRRFGYRVTDSGVYDASTVAVVKSFQSHFRPESVDGIADPSTISTLRNSLLDVTGC